MTKYDVVFVQDATGSQQPYIDAARAEIISISQKLEAKIKSSDVLRFRLIAFRDHEPQDKTFVTKKWDFTTDVNTLKTTLNGLVADGGGDGPEAQIDALNDALNSPWADGAKRTVIMITDSPPHGLGESSDGFASCPCGLDPAKVIAQYVEKHITLHVVACEPTLSAGYSHAHEFWKGMLGKTHGKWMPIGNITSTTTAPVHHAFVGLLLHSFDNHRLTDEYADWVAGEAHRSHDAIASDLHTKMTNASVQHHRVYGTDVYTQQSESDHNVGVWAKADSISDAKKSLKSVPNHRILEKHRDGSGYSVSYAEEAITRPDVNTIVTKALLRKQQADVDSVVDDILG